MLGPLNTPYLNEYLTRSTSFFCVEHRERHAEDNIYAHFAQAHLSKLAFDASHFTVFLHNLVVFGIYCTGMNGTDCH